MNLYRSSLPHYYTCQQCKQVCVPVRNRIYGVVSQCHGAECNLFEGRWLPKEK